jgi:hypothetical protein
MQRRRAKVSTRRKLAFLRRAQTYPGQKQPVQVIETHFAWIFLTERHAYKMKKPPCEALDAARPDIYRQRNALCRPCPARERVETGFCQWSSEITIGTSVATAVRGAVSSLTSCAALRICPSLLTAPARCGS